MKRILPEEKMSWQRPVLSIINEGIATKGNRYIVGETPAGIFSGLTTDNIAWYDGIQWQEDIPEEGWVLYDANQTELLIYLNGPSGNYWYYFRDIFGAAGTSGGSGFFNKLDATTAPTVNDDSVDGYEVGSLWFNITLSKVFQCLNATPTAAVWVELTGGGMSVTNFTTYQDLLNDTTVTEGNIGTVTGMSKRLFIKLTDWFGVMRTTFWGVTSSTLGYWNFNSNNSNDSSANGYNGTDTDMSYTDGKAGRCASFNGTSSCINLPDATIFSCLVDFTISCWIKASTSSQANKVICEFANNTDRTSMIIGYNSGAIQFQRVRQGVAVYGFSFTPVDPIAWHHVVWVFEAAPARLSGYVDGGLVGWITATTAAGTAAVAVRSNIGNTEGVSNYFSGLIDEFIMESKAWNAEEVYGYYETTK